MMIAFHGAARTVTGTKHLVTFGNGQQVLLDCGMFQGLGKKTDELNTNWGFDPSAVSFVLLSHAHIDHSGLLPKLVKDGFKGKIFCTAATRQLTEILLLDSAEIQVHEAAHHNKLNSNEEALYEPLYNLEDVQHTFLLFEEVNYATPFELAAGIEVLFINTGHLVGSAGIHITAKEKNKQ